MLDADDHNIIAKNISTMRGFVAAASAIVGMLMVYMHSSHDDENDLRAYFPIRQLRPPRHPKFINPSFTDPKNVRLKEDIAPSFISNIAPEESADMIAASSSSTAYNKFANALPTKLTNEQFIFLDQLQRMEYSQVKIEYDKRPFRTWSTAGVPATVTTSNDGTLFVYMHIPKTASSHVTAAMRSTGSNMPSKAKTRELATLKDSFVFTTIRHPEDRLASAYGSIITRYLKRISHGWAHELVSTTDSSSSLVPLDFLPIPESPTDITAWEQHFIDSIHQWLETVNNVGWDHPNFYWEHHFLPQIDNLHGYPVSYIVCPEKLDDTLLALGMEPSSGLQNAHEHVEDRMPRNKFQKYEMLREETKELVRKLYYDDYVMYNTFCMQRNNSV